MQLIGQYNVYFVLLSFIIATMASYVAIDIVGRVSLTKGISHRLWLVAGAIVLGLGIWSMHFVGMLAFMLPVSMSYNIPLVIVSVAVAIAASFIALFVASRKTMNHLHLLLGGFFMGSAIVAMHFIGMTAMQMRGHIQYNPPMVILSIVIAYTASFVALKIIFILRTSNSPYIAFLKAISAVIMGSAIAGMHYTGMAAAHFYKMDSHTEQSSYLSFNVSLVAIAIGLVILLIQGVVLFSAFFDRKLAFQTMQLKESEQRYRSLVEYNLDAIASWDLKGNLVTTNKAFYIITGYKAENLVNTPLMSVLDKKSKDITLHYVTKTVKGEPQNFNISIMHKAGHKVDLNVTTVPMYTEEQVVGVYVIAKDITLQKRAEQQIHYMAFHDELTKLPNRPFFHTQLMSSIENAKTRNTKLAVLFLDLNRFKYVNDTLGHTFGDSLLKEIAIRFSTCLGQGDVLARMGGDEFTLLMPNIKSPSEVEQMANRLIETLTNPVLLNGHEIFVSISIGIALYSEDGQDGETLMKHADAAMYWAKEKGQSNYKFYTISLHDNELNKIELEQDLRKAIAGDEFVVYYQPKVDTVTRKIVGMEALVRWNHPTFGLISPQNFIPLAEETGLIMQIGEKVLKAACKQTKAWHNAGFPYLQIAVKVSTRQFNEENFVDIVAGILRETGLNAEYLELEITETTAMTNVQRAGLTLKKLEALGVKIGIDDFGTGYSSLGYLKMFPIHTLKVDQSFVRGMTDNPQNQAIIASIISLAKHMNLTIVAEGVETEGQLAFLKGQECNHVQGYLFSKPIPAKDFEKLIIDNNVNVPMAP